MVSRLWSNKRFAPRKIHNLVWGLVAVTLGLTAQSCLARDRIFEAGFLYGAAVVLIVYALRRQSGPVAPAMPGEEGRARAIYRRGGLASVALACLLAGLALSQFASESVPLSAWLLHMGSVVLFMTAAFVLDRGRTSVSDEGPWSRRELSVLVAILAVAAFMRLYRFDQLPFGTWYDEADNGLHALRMLNEPSYRPVYVESTNLPAHHLYLIAFSFRLLGVSTQGIRAVSVVLGLATVASAYLTGRELFGRRVGLVLAFLLAVSRWDVNWSRIGMHGVSTPLLALLAIGLLLRALRRQRFTDFGWAGLALGVGLCFYAAFRLFPLVVGFFLLHRVLVERGFLRRSWRGLLVFALAVLVTAAPVAQFALRHPEQFWARTRGISIFAGKTPQQAWHDVGESTSKHLLMFNYRGDAYGRHNLPGEPMLDPVSGALMILGIAVCLWRARRPDSLLLPVWLVLMLCPGIFSLEWEAPHSLRAIGSLPAAYLLVVVPIDGLWREWERGIGQRYAGYFGLALVVLLAHIGYTNYHIYFELQAGHFSVWRDFSTAETIAARAMAGLGDTVEFHAISYYCYHPTVRFLAPSVTRCYSLQTDDSLPLPGPPNEDIVLILDAERRSLYEDAQRYYPRATFREYKPPFGGPTVLYLVHLTQADLTRIQGLEGSYYDGEAWAGEPVVMRRDAWLRFDWQDGTPLPFPFSVEWKGVLNAGQYGLYRLILRAPDQAELFLDEALLLKGVGELSAEVVLAKGNHALHLRAVGGEGHFEVAWQPPGEGEQTVPPWALYVPPVTNNGLLGKYFANSDWRPPIALARIDRRLELYFGVLPLPQPYTVEWEGKIFIPESGMHIFGLESIDESVLYIDGQEVTASLPPNRYQEGSIDLESGLHDIRVLFASRTAYAHIYLYWTPPFGTPEIVPVEVLLPAEALFESR